MQEQTALLLSASEASKLCGCSERTWRSWDSAGHIPMPVRIGKSLFWRPKELQQWIDAGCPKRDVWQVRRT